MVTAWMCSHKDRPNKGRGLCQSCNGILRRAWGPKIFEMLYPKVGDRRKDRIYNAYLDLSEMGMSKREIAQQLGVKEETVSQAIYRHNRRKEREGADDS